MAACLTFHASSAATAPAAEPASTAWDGATFEPPFLAGCTPNLTQAAAGYVEAHSALWPDQSDQLLYHDFVREWGFTPAATSTVTCGAVTTDSEPAHAAPGSIPPINEPRWAPTIRYELLNSKTMTAKQGLRLLRAQHLDAGASEPAAASGRERQRAAESGREQRRAAESGERRRGGGERQKRPLRGRQGRQRGGRGAAEGRQRGQRGQRGLAVRVCVCRCLCVRALPKHQSACRARLD